MKTLFSKASGAVHFTGILPYRDREEHNTSRWMQFIFGETTYIASTSMFEQCTRKIRSMYNIIVWTVPVTNRYYPVMTGLAHQSSGTLVHVPIFTLYTSDYWRTRGFFLYICSALISLAKPKSAIFNTNPSAISTFLAARSQCTICNNTIFMLSVYIRPIHTPPYIL